jgi:hypothetical protein
MNLEALNAFKTNANVELLWDVLLNELNINPTNKDNIRTVFDTNLPIFVSSMINKRNKYSIMDLNKEFLSQVVLAVNKLFPKQNVNVKRITITDEDVGEPYKIEDIHASRQSDFDKELERKRIEMETYMTPPKPKELVFSDNMTIDKITSMETIIAEKITQRNMEISSHYDYTNSDIKPSDQWLTPIETSIKNENPTPDKSKKVSWNEPSMNMSMNIFNKLKQTQQPPTIDVKQYSEQKSMSLPNGMPTNGMPTKEMLDRTKISPIMVTQEPILPNSEIIKQLNETNKRIDNLHDMLVSFMEKMNPNTDQT